MREQRWDGKAVANPALVAAEHRVKMVKCLLTWEGSVPTERALITRTTSWGSGLGDARHMATGTQTATLGSGLAHGGHWKSPGRAHASHGEKATRSALGEGSG